MPHQRYYAPVSLLPQDSVLLSSTESHHLAHVLRGKKGDSVELINGKGILAEASIEDISKKGVTLYVEKLLREDPTPSPLVLALGISKMHHLEWAAEKATELGATSLWLFPGSLSEKPTLSDSQLIRLNALMLAATKQCGSLHLPTIEVKPSLLKWPPCPGTLLLCDPSEEVPYLWDLALPQPLPRPIVFFIGPEKGFSKEELTFAQDTLLAHRVRLHPHTLRAETAPLVALSLIQPFL